MILGKLSQIIYSSIKFNSYRLFREDEQEFTVRDSLKVSIARLMRINRNLNRYHSAVEIITLLKNLQAQYNSGSSEFHVDPDHDCAKTARRVEELIEYIKSDRFQANGSSTHQSSSNEKAQTRS